MKQIQRFTSNLFGFAQNLANTLGQARQAENGTILDEITTQVYSETLRFKDSLATNPDYDNFISEDGSKGLFAEHKKKMLDYVSERTKEKPWLKNEAANIVNKFLAPEESDVRKLQTQRMVDIGLTKDLGAVSTMLDSVNGEEFNFLFNEKYAELKKRYEPFMLLEYFNQEYQKAAGASLTRLIDKGMDEALSTGGKQGLDEYIKLVNGPDGKGLTPIDYQGMVDAGLDNETLLKKGLNPEEYREAQKVFMGESILFDEGKLQDQANKKYDTYKKAQEVALEQTLIGSFFERKDLPGTVGILTSNNFKEYVDIATQEKWWNRLQNEIDDQSKPVDEKYQKQIDDFVEKEWLNLMSTGKTMDSPSVKNFLLSTAKLASPGIETRITNDWKKWEYGLTPQADIIIQGVLKDKAITDEAMRGEIVQGLKNRFQELRNQTIDYGKVSKAVIDDIKGEKYKKLVNELASAGFGGVDVTLSATEAMQIQIQEGTYRNAVRAVEVSGVDKNIFQTKTGTGYITPDQKTMAMHWQTQYKLAKETFDLADEGETRVSRGDPLIPDGQLIFKEADGSEYAFMIPWKTEKGKIVYEKDEKVYKIEAGKAPELAKDFKTKAQRAKAELKEEKKIEAKEAKEKQSELLKKYAQISNPPPNYSYSAYGWSFVSPENRGEWIKNAPDNWKRMNGFME